MARGATATTATTTTTEGGEQQSCDPAEEFGQGLERTPEQDDGP